MPTIVRLGPLAIDTRRSRASLADAPMDLSLRQFEILLLLAVRAGEFVHRQDIANTLRQGREEGSRSIDMHISRIRRKLQESGPNGLAIGTVYGLGYCLTFETTNVVGGDESLRWCA